MQTEMLTQYSELATATDNAIDKRAENDNVFANLAVDYFSRFSGRNGIDAHNMAVFIQDYLNDRFPCQKKDSDAVRDRIKWIKQAINREGENSETYGGLTVLTTRTGKNAAGVKVRKVKVEFTSTAMLDLLAEQAEQDEKLQAERAEQVEQILAEEHEKAILAMTPAEIVAEMREYFASRYTGHDEKAVIAEWKYQLTEHAAPAKDGKKTGGRVDITADNVQQVVNQ